MNIDEAMAALVVLFDTVPGVETTWGNYDMQTRLSILEEMQLRINEVAMRDE